MGYNRNMTTPFIFACYLLTIMLSPLYALFFLLALSVRCLLVIYLKSTYGDKYVSMVSGLDSIWILGDPEKLAIDGLLVVEPKTLTFRQSFERAKDVVVSSILRHPEKYPKLTSTLHKKFGYGFFLKANCNIDELLTTIYIDETSEYYSKSLEKIISEKAYDPFPENNKVLWKVVYFDGCLKWKAKNNMSKNDIAIWVRMHHTIGDGVSIMAFTINEIFDKSIDFEEILNHLIKAKKLMPSKLSLQKILLMIHLILLTPGYYVFSRLYYFIKWRDVNVSSLTYGQRNISFSVEDEAFDKIKRIKNKVTGTAFVDIINTAFSASLQKYYDDNKLEVPKETILSVPALVESNTNFKSMKLEGTAGFYSLHLPIKFESTSMLKRLKHVKEKSRNPLFGIGLQARYFMANYLCRYFPSIILALGDNLEYVTICLSNVPPVPKLYAGKEFDVKNMYFAPPNFAYLAISSILIVYANKVHICIATDSKKFPPEYNSKLLENFFENIRLMDEEVNKCS